MPRGVPGSTAPHGTYSRYRNQGCRCDLCRQAHTDYIRLQSYNRGRHTPRAELLAQMRENPPPHGTESRYTCTYAPCRCAKCKKASRDARAKRRAAA